MVRTKFYYELVASHLTVYNLLELKGSLCYHRSRWCPAQHLRRLVSQEDKHSVKNCIELPYLYFEWGYVPYSIDLAVLSM